MNECFIVTLIIPLTRDLKKAKFFKTDFFLLKKVNSDFCSRSESCQIIFFHSDCRRFFLASCWDGLTVQVAPGLFSRVKFPYRHKITNSIGRSLFKYGLFTASFWIYFFLFPSKLLHYNFINFTMVNDARKRERRKSMHRSITCFQKKPDTL